MPATGHSRPWEVVSQNLVSNLNSTPWELCNAGPVSKPLCTPVFSFGDYQSSCHED